MIFKRRRFLSLAALLLALAVAGTLANARRAQHETGGILGRWDITIQAPWGAAPSWLEVEQSGATKVGRFVGMFGSARPVSEVEFKDGKFRVAIPKQYERENHVFEGTLNGDTLSGMTTGGILEQPAKWTAQRAPALKRTGKPQWGTPIELFNGKDLDGWKPRNAQEPNGWKVENGVLINAKPGNDLVTTRTFDDFKLHAEFRYPAGSNSGLYLRGRYELQIEDNYGQEPHRHGIASIYGFIAPCVNPSKKPGEWQTYDITLVGRAVTVVFNGETVIERQQIPGITGGALESDEGKPGPLFIQGDHGQVEFRKLTLTPAK